MTRYDGDEVKKVGLYPRLYHIVQICYLDDLLKSRVTPKLTNVLSF